MTQTPERFRAIMQALFVTLLWSTSWVFIKITLQDVPPLIFAGLRYTLATLVLLPGLYKVRDQVRDLTKRDWIQLSVLGLVFYTLTQGGQFLTLNHLEAVTFSLLLNFSSVLVAIMGIIGLGEAPTRRQWVGIAIFIIGVVVYFYPSISLTGRALGFVFAGLTIGANAIASLLGRSINEQKRIPPTVVTVISMGIGALVLLGSGLIVEDFPQLTLRNMMVIVLLGVVNSALAFTLWNKSLQVLSAVESSVINNTMLIQIAFLAWVFLGERPSILDSVGLIIAGVGILLVNLKK